ncbi:hypothetical protein PMAYCL1PPCAC_15085, partial [Pristionchus mayeri]
FFTLHAVALCQFFAQPTLIPFTLPTIATIPPLATIPPYSQPTLPTLAPPTRPTVPNFIMNVQSPIGIRVPLIEEMQMAMSESMNNVSTSLNDMGTDNQNKLNSIVKGSQDNINQIVKSSQDNILAMQRLMQETLNFVLTTPKPINFAQMNRFYFEQLKFDPQHTLDLLTAKMPLLKSFESSSTQQTPTTKRAEDLRSKSELRDYVSEEKH